MKFADARALWDAHAQTDPLWAVLSAPDKRGRRWRLREFMQDGEREIARLVGHLAELRIDTPQAPVLDFGCGVGRLTQALGRRFDDVTGADISPRMVAVARAVNQLPDRVRYICTSEQPLDALPGSSFGFIYSNIVLQHMPPAEAMQTIGQWLRLLRAGGLVVFQLPSHRHETDEFESVPMTEASYAGAVEAAGRLPSVAAPGEEIALPILVRNTSGHTWSQPGAGPMAAGNHWLDAIGTRMLQQDDARAPLPQVMKSGSERRLVIRMRAPSTAGAYVCEIDLVHEGVTWFADRGSRTLRFPVDVRASEKADDVSPFAREQQVPEYPDTALPEPSADVEAPPESDPFPMNGVPHDEVLRFLEARGARLLHVEEDRHAGADWVSYTYFVGR